MAWARAGKAPLISEAERWALAVWLLVVGIILGRALATPATHSVYPIYVQAARDWLAGTPLYGNVHESAGLDEFRYSPPLAVLFVPFTLLPNDLGGMCWRVLCLAVYLGGFVGLCRGFWPELSERSGSFRALLAISLVPLSIASMNNGQANVLVIGLLVGAGTLLLQGRNNGAAACLAFASVIKVYPAVVALLFLAIYFRRLAWPFVGTVVALMVLPFLCQWPEYVTSQYHEWWLSTVVDLPTTAALQIRRCDLGSLLCLLHLDLSPMLYQGVQIVSGIALVGMMVRRRRQGWEETDLVRTALDLGCCWLVLLGPCTESCTYILAAPTLAWALAEAWHGHRLRLGWLLVALSCFLAAMLEKSLGVSRVHLGLAGFFYPLGAILLVLERLAADPNATLRLRSIARALAHQRPAL